MFSQMHDVFVAIFSEDFYFADHGFANVRILIFILFELFNGNNLASFAFLRFENFAVSTFANQL